MDENDISQYYETISIHTESSQTNVTKTKTSDSITRIYACATMWHETQSEMLEMLKSIFRYVFLVLTLCCISHRELKLDGAKGDFADPL